tara:strand:+ start:700 stop:1569 length:870 start_codon:yes stop_codon:yes gene_type:complete
MIDIKSLIAFRDEMTKIAGPPIGPIQTNYMRDTGKTQKLPPAQPAPPKQVAAPKPPKTYKFNLKGYKAPKTLKGASFIERAKFIQSQKGKYNDRSTWNRTTKKMMNEWWKDRNAQRAADKANKNAGPAPAITPGKASTAFQGQKLVPGGLLGGKKLKLAPQFAKPVGPDMTAPPKDGTPGRSSETPVPKTTPKSVPAASSAFQGQKLAPQSSQPAGPGGQVAPTARPKAKPTNTNKRKVYKRFGETSKIYSPGGGSPANQLLVNPLQANQAASLVGTGGSTLAVPTPDI